MTVTSSTASSRRCSTTTPRRSTTGRRAGTCRRTPDGTIIKVNATFLALTGYAREDLVGRRRFVDLLTGGGRIYHETHYAPMLRLHGIAREIALDLVCADGRRLPVLVNAVLERDEAGSPLVIRTAVFDASHRRRYEEELLREKQRATSLARTLQQTLIPPHVPSIDGLQVAAEYRPAGDGTEVGGDFYDIFQADDDDWVVTIGDVCGKGVGAAVVTALARYTLRAAAMQDPSPAHGLVAAERRADPRVTATGSAPPPCCGFRRRDGRVAAVVLRRRPPAAAARRRPGTTSPRWAGPAPCWAC